MKRAVKFPEDIQFIGRDVGEDCRRMAAAIARNDPDTDMIKLMATVAYQLGRACASIVAPEAIPDINARILLDAQYNFARGQIAALTEGLR